MRLLTWIVGLAVAVITVLFAISNRAAVTVEIWPFPFAAELRLYLVVLVSVFGGFCVGALVTWVAGGVHRRRVRRQKAEIRNLEKDLEQARARASDAERSVAA